MERVVMDDTEAKESKNVKPVKPKVPIVVAFQAPPPRAAKPAVETTTKSTAKESDSDDVAKSESKPRAKTAPRGKSPAGTNGRRRKGKAASGDDALDSPEKSIDESDGAVEAVSAADTDASDDDSDSNSVALRRRRRRRRRGGETADPADDSSDADGETVVKVREPRAPRANTRPARASTRMDAKRQRRRDGRTPTRRRGSLLSEAEFLARRESVDRVMLMREKDQRVQIAVLEDDILVEHYVTQGQSSSLIGNVYLGRVQNVLPSMEAAFVDIGQRRNAVLYAGEVNWDAAGLEGKSKRIETALKSGDPVLVQVTKDSVGQKGARLTSQISLPGRFVVYVPDGSMTGISRKLPEGERNRLKAIFRDLLPDDAGVIIRTAAEGATEEQLQRDVARLKAQWEDIKSKGEKAKPPSLLYAEPDLALRVVRDIFNEDFAKLAVSGADTYDTLEAYLGHIAPDLLSRLEKWVEKEDLFTAKRVDEQLVKALDRKVFLPSGGSLVIDRTEAMTVIDVNTGRFTGQGGGLEDTVTANNLEAAEEIVRQLRLRDVGGIIVIDFIDMVLETNRDAVLRRLVECLGRDRTKHQVAEVTSLGLVQMTRKRIGQGLLETFSEICEACNGRGVQINTELISVDPSDDPFSAQSGEDEVLAVAAN
jgi:ribonuclease E